MRFSRGERSRWLSLLSLRLSYDPFDNNLLTGYCRPPPFAPCVIDYFRAISHCDNGFQIAEMRLLMEDPNSFYPRLNIDGLNGVEDTIVEYGEE